MDANLTAIVVASIGALGGFLSFLQASRVQREAKRMELTRVDAEAYERARVFDKEVISNFREEIKRLQDLLEVERIIIRDMRAQIATVDDLYRELGAVRQELEDAHGVNQKLSDKVAELESRVAELLDKLRDHDERITNPS